MMKRLRSAIPSIILMIVVIFLPGCSGLQPGPDTAQRYHERGILDLKPPGDGGDAEKAVEYFTNAIKAEPNFAKSYNARGVAYVLLGEYDKARQDFVKALEVSPENLQARENLEHLDAGAYDEVDALEN